MFARSFTALVAMLVLTLTLAATAAMATDEPAPAPQSAPCVDKTKPLSRLGGNFKRGFRKGVIRGIAIDQGCGANGAGTVKRVQIAIARKVGKRCQSLLSNGHFGRATSCTHVWLNAKGTNRWSFRVGHRLANGKYMVATRAIDSAGNFEAHAKR